MPRIAALLLCALAAVVATATPAPEPKPWVTGWDKPVDPKGDCSFERKGDELTITVPGEGYRFDIFASNLNAPHLLRNVEGDFVVEARVSGNCWSATVDGRVRCAGILLTAAEKATVLTLGVTCEEREGQPPSVSWSIWGERKCPAGTGRHLCPSNQTSPPGTPIFLRVERRGETLNMSFREGRRGWRKLDWPPKTRLPQKVKVGVFAESTDEGEFKVVFDKFKLTRPGN